MKTRVKSDPLISRVCFRARGSNQSESQAQGEPNSIAFVSEYVNSASVCVRIIDRPNYRLILSSRVIDQLFEIFQNFVRID